MRIILFFLKKIEQIAKQVIARWSLGDNVPFTG